MNVVVGEYDRDLLDYIRIEIANAGALRPGPG
jgi:hypothetical protein